MMLTVIDDSNVESRLREARARSGGDRYDEVWEGISMMAPMPNHEHQVLVGRLTRVLDEIVTDQELGSVVPGVNISDRVDGWDLNYRVPDVAVFLNTTRAVNHDSFWFGGPDFAVEITSPDDRSREKLDFYGKIGTRELLIVDRESWTL
ncbi:MAG: Uma2 family endonuclease, partial [Planctomycetaceae bacterium]